MRNGPTPIGVAHVPRRCTRARRATCHCRLTPSVQAVPRSSLIGIGNILKRAPKPLPLVAMLVPVSGLSASTNYRVGNRIHAGRRFETRPGVNPYSVVNVLTHLPPLDTAARLQSHSQAGSDRFRTVNQRRRYERIDPVRALVLVTSLRRACRIARRAAPAATSCPSGKICRLARLGPTVGNSTRLQGVRRCYRRTGSSH